MRVSSTHNGYPYRKLVQNNRSARIVYARLKGFIHSDVSRRHAPRGVSALVLRKQSLCQPSWRASAHFWLASSMSLLFENKGSFARSFYSTSLELWLLDLWKAFWTFLSIHILSSATSTSPYLPLPHPTPHIRTQHALCSLHKHLPNTREKPSTKTGFD